jgi:hypothetical protein
VTTPRHPRRSLTAADLKLIGEAVTEAVRDEFIRIGLATVKDEDAVEAQKDFAFIRKARMGAEAAGGIIGSSVIKGCVYVIGLILAAGIGSFLASGRFPPAH